MRLVEDSAVAEDAEYGGRAEDDAGVETVSEAETAMRDEKQTERHWKPTQDAEDPEYQGRCRSRRRSEKGAGYIDTVADPG